MNKILTVVALIMAVTPALSHTASGSRPAPTLEQTFQDVGRAISTSQVPASPGSPSGRNDFDYDTVIRNMVERQGVTVPGATVTATTVVHALTKPNPKAPVGATLSPGTPILVGGVENSFVQLTPLQGPMAGQPFYVPEETVKIGFSGVMIDSANKVESTGKVDSAGKQTEKFLQDAARIALTLQDNPHMRLKGFRLNVATPQNLELEFEMKGGAEPAAAAAPNR
jgi:hypothetical protein